MDSMTMLFSIVAAGLIVPLVEYIRKKLPGDFPIQAPLYAAVLSVGAAWGLSKWVAPTMTMDEVIQLSLGTQVLSQFFHSIWKTKQENTL